MAEQNQDNKSVANELAELMNKSGARTSPVTWASILLDNAEEETGISGQELLDRSARLKKGESAGDFEELKYHFTTYANDVRNTVAELVQRRYIPSVINVTRMAVSYLSKDPISKDNAEQFADRYAQFMVTSLQNTLSNYLQQIRAFDLTFEILEELDFYTVMEQSIRDAYQAFLDEHWSTLMPLEE